MISLKKAILNKKAKGKNPIISEIKVYSPKEGELVGKRDVVKLAKEMESAGAVGISVVTEGKYFHGSLDILKKVRQNVSLPILRKDFITSKRQLDESKEAGADINLLIVAKTPVNLLKELIDYSHRLEMEVLVEIHTEDELNRLKDLGVDILGINNRDILRLEMDDGNVSTTEKIAKKMKGKFPIISESGVKTKEDIKRVMSFVDGVLIGTAILKSENIGGKIKWLMSD
jgi:indole-3-glycerol phosphate synthase